MTALEDYITNYVANGTFTEIESNIAADNFVEWTSTTWYHVLAAVSTNDADSDGFYELSLKLSLDGTVVRNNIYEVQQDTIPDLYSKFVWVKQLGVLSHTCVSSSKDKPVRYVNFTGPNAAYEAIIDNGVIGSETGINVQLALVLALSLLINLSLVGYVCACSAPVKRWYVAKTGIAYVPVDEDQDQDQVQDQDQLK
jgi:hypothetical protein